MTQSGAGRRHDLARAGELSGIRSKPVCAKCGRAGLFTWLDALRFPSLKIKVIKASPGAQTVSSKVTYRSSGELYCLFDHGIRYIFISWQILFIISSFYIDSVSAFHGSLVIFCIKKLNF